jgi:hypothetical protein
VNVRPHERAKEDAMFKRYVMSGMVAVACSAALTVGAAAQSASPGATAQKSAGGTTIQGCVARAQDVPGRSPNVPNPAGVSDGYVVMHTSGEAVGTSGSAAGGAVGSSGTSGNAGARGGATTATEKVGPIYKIVGISDDTLKSLVGKRVELSGSINQAAASDRDADSDHTETSKGNANPVGPGSQTQTGTDANAGRGDEKDHFMELKAASIREVSGSCPSPAPSGSAR